METIKQLLEKYARPFLSKQITRWLLIGLAAICAKLGLDEAEHYGWIYGFSDFAAAAALAIAQILLDKYHHNKDLAQVPPKKK